MDQELRTVIESKFQVPVVEGEDKVCSLEEAIAEIKEKMGWQVDLDSDLNRVQPPTKEEIDLLRLFDPRGYFIGA